MFCRVISFIVVLIELRCVVFCHAEGGIRDAHYGLEFIRMLFRSLQGTLQNIAAGIMLLALRPLRAGEYVSVVGKGDGTVAEVGLFLTRLIQIDGIHLTLPNSLVWGNPIINYSRNATRRLDVEVSVRYGDDLELALRELGALVQNHQHVLPDPKPQVMVHG